MSSRIIQSWCNNLPSLYTVKAKYFLLHRTLIHPCIVYYCRGLLTLYRRRFTLQKTNTKAEDDWYCRRRIQMQKAITTEKDDWYCKGRLLLQKTMDRVEDKYKYDWYCKKRRLNRDSHIIFTFLREEQCQWVTITKLMIKMPWHIISR